MQKQVNNAIYEDLGDRWYSAYDDPIALLRAESITKYYWIKERISAEGLATRRSLLDIGCGAGFLSNKFSQDGFNVSGIDLSGESLRVAKKYDSGGKVAYLEADAYNLPMSDHTFDIITCMDFLEHVDRPADIVKEAARVLKPGGLFFYHTFNRNFLSWLIIIKAVELLVANTQKNMHILRLFIKPKELASMCEAANMSPMDITGLRPIFLKPSLIKAIFTGNVPKDFEFTLTRSLKLSYLGYAKKKF